MKKLVFFTLALLFSVVAVAQNEPVNYHAAIVDFKQFYNNNQPQNLYVQFGDEMKKALTPAKWDETMSQLKTQLGPLLNTNFEKFDGNVAYYKAGFEKAFITLSISVNGANQITGLLLRPYQNRSQAAEVNSDDPSIQESPVSVKTLAGMISGTLGMPKNVTGKIPVVLIIPGSGPTDRDGNSGQLGLNTNMYKLLAVALAKNGIASLRYDKRLVGKSISAGAKEADLRFEDYVEDAISLETMLAGDERFSKVIVFGHSEGSLVGMLSSIDEPVKGYISAAGAGDSADKILTEQMKSKPPYIVDGFKRVLDSLRRGKIYKEVDPGLYFIARPSIQRYLMSWCRYNPKIEIKKLKIPVLILQGTTDIQVTVADAEKLKKAKSDASLVTITGMSHILKEGPEDKEKNAATYNDPALPLKPELVTAVVEFVKKI
jgi:pimeloyl-ACP methyl ester carboxylesterase